MSAIVTITFNPCIDKSTTVASIMPDKKLRCAEPKFEPGGGGINVSRAIKKLGGNATAIYPAGGYSGKFLKSLLDNEGVDSIFIETASQTRENLIVVDESTNSQYRFGMPGSMLSEKEWEKCLQAINKRKEIEYIVASGSLPAGAPVDGVAQLAIVAKTINARLIIDTSGEALVHALKEGVYLIKPNLNELSQLTGKTDMDKEQIIAQSRNIINSGSCEIMVVSLGAEGALLINKETAVQFITPVVEQKSTVGAGDSMLAGIVFSLQKNKPIKEAVQYGVACGTAATMNAGTELCRAKDVKQLYPMIQSVIH